MASGIGITPMRALLEELPQKPGDVTLVYRAHDESELIFVAELSHLAADRGPGRDSARTAGHVSTKLAPRECCTPV